MNRLRNRAMPERTLVLYDDDQVKQNAEAARLRLEAARAAVGRSHVGRGDVPPAAGVEADPAVVTAVRELEVAEAALAAARIRLTFRALPRPEYDTLLAEHPPTEAQSKSGIQDYNPDSFPAVLVSACSVDGMTVEDATDLLGRWAPAEARALFQIAVAVCQQLRADLEAVGKG